MCTRVALRHHPLPPATTHRHRQGDPTTTLAFDPRVEAQIFYTVPTEVLGPHETFGQYDNTHGVPTHYFYSGEHTISSKGDIEWLDAHFPSATMELCEGQGHFYPLFDPVGFAGMIEPAVLALCEGTGNGPRSML